MATASTTPSLASGAHTVTASYSGDAGHTGSSAAFTVTEAAQPTSPPTAGSAIYSYSITQPGGISGYAANGNVTNYTDSVNGAWSAGYDSLNRLTSATQTQINGTPATAFNSPSQNFCWTYDSFGNRTQQAVSDGSFGANCQTTSSNVSRTVASYDPAGNNRITSVSGVMTNDV